MTVHERRKQARNQLDPNESAFVEIRHTYGPIRKSIYQVVEFDERGMSFLVPIQDGYFRPGVPLEYSLFNGDRIREERFGAVKYYHPYNDQAGNAFYKVGVEIDYPRRNTRSKDLRIRPTRYRLAELRNSHAVHFALGDKELSFPLLDISRYSAAFYCTEEDVFSLGTSTALKSVSLTFGEKTIFDGTVIITRQSPEGERHRIVIEPCNATFNIDIIEEQENLASVGRSFDALIAACQKYQSIDNAFKAIVADMRGFLEGYRKILDMPLTNKLSLETDPITFLDELNKVFYPQLDGFVMRLDDVVNALNLTESEHGLYKTYFQNHFHALLMSSPFCHRMYFKPLGYPGDYEMMRMIGENAYEGPTLFAKLVNKHVLQNPMAQANRNRIQYLADKIARFIATRDKPTVRLLSIASGPALEIQQLIEKYPDLASRIDLTLLDQEVFALRYSQDNIYLKRIMSDSRIRVRLIHQSIGTFLKNIHQDRHHERPYDMIYIFGLFDYFDDRTCAFCLNRAARLLEADGALLISNYSLDGHQYRTYLEYAFEWYMTYRNKEQMLQLGRSITHPCALSVDEDPSGVIKFLEILLGERR